jgi:rSAM/selenodomain-associated transferase 2
LTRLAIIVPTLDEEDALRRHLAAAAAEADLLVVSDGGSRDGTLEVARRAGATVVCGPPGRGGQLNRGAAAAAGADVLLFLHADTRLPPGAGGDVRRAVAAGAAGGAFFVRFDDDGFWMRLGSRLVALRTRLTRLPLGDQAQFVRRDVFAALGGFRDWPILEDLDLARRLKAHAGRRGVALLRPPAVTSARRYRDGGIARTVARNWLIWGLFALGVPPHRLARLYPPRGGVAPRR